jgi:tRNA dimethylallyltransferase
MIIITGQTATGKTKLALALAKKHNGELINFDSRQIYKYLDIITGKDIPKNKIWLYDVVAPNEYFSSFDFVKQVEPIIKDVIKRGKTPILVGGTYLYLKHLLYGFEDSRSPPDFKLRDQLNDKSVTYLQKMLIKLNRKVFESLNHSDQLNPRRLIRKIELETGVETSGIPTTWRRPFGSRTLAGKKARQAPFQLIGLRYADKNKLRQIIEKRVAKRLKQGAVVEVKKLLQMGYKETDPGLKTIGYQQIIKYLNKKMTKEQAIQDWINKEVQYAKRQLTFMKKDKNIKWREIY